MNNMSSSFRIVKIVILLSIFALVGAGILLTKVQISEKNKMSDQIFPKPQDFLQIRRDIQNGIFFSLSDLGKEYYLQPDFYPSFKSTNEPHDFSRWGVQGYGAYPGEISYSVENFKKGQYINTFTFVKAGENIETFQGLKFNMKVSEPGASDLFFTSVTPDTVMFTPTFPNRREYIIDNRTYDWAYKLNIVISANADIPPGKYEFNLIGSSPEEKIQKLYYEDVLKINQSWYKCPDDNKKCDDNIIDLRKKVYVSGGNFQADKFFKFIIYVK
jgi:hypothetical protein